MFSRALTDRLIGVSPRVGVRLPEAVGCPPASAYVPDQDAAR
jgi:hypothetical protein